MLGRLVDINRSHDHPGESLFALRVPLLGLGLRLTQVHDRTHLDIVNVHQQIHVMCMLYS
jgi:hypothetical protein